MALSSIHNLSFLSLEGPFEGVREELEILRRPGVDGVALWKTGRRGRPIVALSRVDAQSKTHARQLFAAYQALIGADPVKVVWSGLDLESLHQVKFAVLDVRVRDLRALASSSGGVHSPSLGWIECEWDLLPIAVNS